MSRSQLLVLAAIVFIVSQAMAQKPPPAVDSARAKLQFLAGRFTTEVSMPPGPGMPKGATGKGTSLIVWALDSAFLMIDEQSINSLLGNYKGHGMLYFDPNVQQYMLTMYNNFGDHPSYKGDFFGDTLVLLTKVPMPGHPFDQKLLWYKDGGTVKLKVMNDIGKGFALALEQTATPVTGKAK
ncbi:MAG TPA: hypothetical protein VLY03_03395 [Bacteroidota bacterium]|nr:hypothetical protein [Bacteroidota bacterium]